jgi:chromosome segregation ATPase
MMEEISMTLDAESRELARQLGVDLCDLLSTEPDWAKPIRAAVEALHTKKAPAWMDPLTAKLSTLEIRMIAIETVSSKTKELLGKLPAREELQAVTETMKKDLEAKLNTYEGAVTGRMEALSKDVKTNREGIVGIETVISSLKIPVEALSVNMGSVKEDTSSGLEILSRLTSGQQQLERNIVGIGDQLTTLRSEIMIQKALVERLAKPWYRRLFGG